MIYREQVEIGLPFLAPRNITLGYQKERKAISVWFNSDDEKSCSYVVLGTGHDLNEPGELVASIVVDGFYAWHLIRKT